MERFLLAIESSCDETAAAVFALDQPAPHPGSALCCEVIASQVAEHAPYGGVVPELASREHIKNLPVVVGEALAKAGADAAQLAAVAVTRGPGLNGCLLVGVEYAKGLAYASGADLIGIHHLEAHLAASFLLETGEQPEFPCLALLVSGGHSSLVLWHGARRYQTIAETRDDAAGEAFDKVAALLGLGYPGGPALAAAAEAVEPTDVGRFEFPIGVPNDSASFSFSGFKTAVQRAVRSCGALDQRQVRAIASAAQGAIIEALIAKVEQAIDSCSPRSLLLAGGVAANRCLRERAAESCARHGLKLCILPPRWCTDNAAMVGACALRILADGAAGAGRDARLKLSMSSRARWPLDEVML